MSEPKKEGVIINRMYVGDYLSQNLGHEVINLFQDDKGRHYLYLNQSGSLSAEHKYHDTMILVRYEGNNLFEVVGMAKGLQPADGITEKRSRDLKIEQENISQLQMNYIEQKQEGISYDGVSILDIFGEAGQQNVFITFRADEVRIPKDDLRIFIEYNSEAEDREKDGEIFVVMKNHNLPKTSLKSYITPYVKNGNKEMYSPDCRKLIERITNNPSLWADKTDWKVNSANRRGVKPVSLFDICEIQNDENRLTNAMAYFMRQPEYRDLWRGFFKDKMRVTLNENYKVERERDISHVSVKVEEQKEGEEPKLRKEKLSGRIDLFIQDDDSIIVIENKIKSDINTNQNDKSGRSQLDRYKDYVEAIDSENKKSHRYFILSPNYNKPHLSENMERIYERFTYRDIYEYLNRKENAPLVESDPNFKAFRDVIHRHTLSTPNGYLYYEMMEKFYSRINELKTKNNID